MKRISLDTSAYSAFRSGSPETVHFIRYAEEIRLSVVTLGELRAGFRNGSRYPENEEALLRFLASPRVTIHPITDGTTHYYGSVFAELKKRGRPLPQNDLWIASCALESGTTLVSADKHFLDVPLLQFRHVR